MTPRRRSKLIRISITGEEIQDFLDKLATDESFRERLRDRPREVLLDYRIDVSPETIEGPIDLPTEEELRQFADSIRNKLYQGDPDEVLGYTVLAFVLGGLPRPWPPIP
jgi:hypothetical protein